MTSSQIQAIAYALLGIPALNLLATAAHSVKLKVPS